LEARAALAVEETLEMAEQAIGKARAGVSRAHVTRRSAARIDARIREVAGWADLIRFHVNVTPGVNGGVIVESAIDYGRVSQPSVLGFVPIGPKRIAGMSTFQKFLDLLEDSLTNADATAQIRLVGRR
jgi:hypothetical protein